MGKLGRFLVTQTVGLCIALSPAQAEDPPAAAVEVQGLTEGKLRISGEGPQIVGYFVVREIAGADASNVQLEAGQLTAAGQPPQELSFDPQTFSLRARGMQTVQVKAVLPAVATYEAAVQIRWQAEPAPELLFWKLEVERRKPPAESPSLALEAPARLQVGMMSGAGLRFEVREKRGRPLAVYRPRLAGLTWREQIGAEPVEVYPSQVTIRRCDGELPAVKAPATPAQLKSFEAHCLAMEIHGIYRSGSYTATLAAATPAGEEVTAEVELRLRHFWLLPFLVLGLGVFASQRLRRWWGVDRPRLLAEKELAELRRDVARALVADDPDDQRVRTLLQDELDSLVADLYLSPGVTVAEELKTLSQHLEDYRLIRGVLSLDVEDVVWDPERRPETGRRRVELRETFAQPDLLARLTTLRKEAEKLEEDIAGWNQRFLEGQLTELENEATALEKKDSAPVTEEVRTLLQAATRALATARASLKTQDLAAARPAYLKARRALAETREKRAVPVLRGGRATDGTDRRGAAAAPGEDVGGLLGLERPRTVRDIVAEVRRKDRWAFWIAVVAAAAIGFKAVYLPDPVFGSLGDYIEAFLWGFGVHQLTTLSEAVSPLRLSPAESGANQ